MPIMHLSSLLFSYECFLLTCKDFQSRVFWTHYTQTCPLLPEFLLINNVDLPIGRSGVQSFKHYLSSLLTYKESYGAISYICNSLKTLAFYQNVFLSLCIYIYYL